MAIRRRGPETAEYRAGGKLESLTEMPEAKKYMVADVQAGLCGGYFPSTERCGPRWSGKSGIVVIPSFARIVS